MGYILNMSENKKLILSQDTTTYVGENNADNIKIFLPKTFQGYDLKDECFVVLYIIIPDSENESLVSGDAIELKLEYNSKNDRYISKFNISDIYTQKEQKVILKLQILKSDEVLAYTNEVSFNVIPHLTMNDVIPEGGIKIFEQYILEMSEIKEEFKRELDELLSTTDFLIKDNSVSKKKLSQELVLELDSKVDNETLGDIMSAESNARQEADAVILSNIGKLSDLKTTKKTSLVGAINELADSSGSGEITDGSITSEKLADGAVTYDKLNEEIKNNIASTDYVDGAIAEAKSIIPKRYLVTELPVENIDMNGTYLIPADEPNTENIYIEYAYINGAWEIIGNPFEVDLSEYCTIEQMISHTAQEVNVIASGLFTEQAMREEADNNILEKIGDISTLTPYNKTSLVGAINAVEDEIGAYRIVCEDNTSVLSNKIGELLNLKTQNQDSLVDAINELSNKETLSNVISNCLLINDIRDYINVNGERNNPISGAYNNIEIIGGFKMIYNGTLYEVTDNMSTTAPIADDLYIYLCINNSLVNLDVRSQDSEIPDPYNYENGFYLGKTMFYDTETQTLTDYPIFYPNESLIYLTSKIGEDADVDLSNYYTKLETDDKFATMNDLIATHNTVSDVTVEMRETTGELEESLSSERMAREDNDAMLTGNIENLRDEVHELKGTVSTFENSSYTFEFSNTYNTEIRLPEVSNISFTFGDGEYTDDYISGLSFDSGEVPTSIDYTDSGILNWVGTDCSTSDKLSIFQPSANTHYDIVFYFNGRHFIGLVNGFVPAIGNVVSE